MIKRMLLIMMAFSLAAGSFWAGQAQDPPPQNVRTDPPAMTAQSTQTDLSGTYAGTFNCEAIGLMGDTTLTINGNEFTTADGKSGRIVASTTGGYTAVALQLGGTEPAAAPTIVSLRARKSGNRLTLTSVGGAGQKCSFTTSRNVARGRRTPRTPAATGAEVANPAAVPSAAPTESPIPSQTPSPRPSPTPSPSPSEPMPSPTPTPSPGEPMPSPSPSEPMPTPAPSPSPGEPMPSPTPPSPSPSPSPTPSPSPRMLA